MENPSQERHQERHQEYDQKHDQGRGKITIDIKFVLRDLGPCELALVHKDAKIKGVIVLLCRPDDATKVKNNLRDAERYTPGAYFVE